MRAFILVLTMIPALAAAAAVRVEQPRIVEPPPGAPVAGGFMVLRNPTAETRALVAVRSDAFGKIEMHKSFRRDGVARMEAQERIPVPAQGETELRHGGYHLMLMQAKQPVKAGAELPLVLEFDDGSTVEVLAPVRRMGHGGR